MSNYFPLERDGLTFEYNAFYGNVVIESPLCTLYISEETVKEIYERLEERGVYDD